MTGKRVVMIGTRMDTMGGIAAVLAVYRDSGFLDRNRVVYVPTHCDGGASAKLKVMLLAMWRVLWLLLAGKVGLLHVHTSSRASFWRKTLFFAPAFLARVPVILHLHGSEFAVFHDQECGPLRQRLIRAVFNRCAVVLVLSESWRHWVQGMCGNPRVTVLFNPVVMPAWHAGKKPNQLLFLGRIGQRKGAFDLIRAVSSIAAAHPHLRLKMGGDGAVDEARRQVQAAHLEDQVELIGWVRGAAKQQLLAESGIFVLPSYHEGLPMAILEAMAAGMAVLSTPVGGIGEAVRDGQEGFLTPPGDPHALAERLGQLLADPSLCANMGAAARQRAQEVFSTDAVLPQLEAVYGSLGLPR